MKEFENIEIEVKDRLATLWLNEPEKRNALNITTIEEIISGLKWLEKQEKVTVILIRGRGKSFCAGANISSMIASGKSGYKNCFQESRKLAKCFELIYLSQKVIIGMAHGDIYGGGVGILGASDFTLATKDSRFCLPELKLGLVPSVIMPYLLLRVKQTDLRYQILTGEVFNAEVAYQKGLIDTICNDIGDMEIRMKEFAEKIYKASPAALAETKNLLRKLNNHLINADNIRNTVKTITLMKMSEDAQERMTRFSSR